MADGVFRLVRHAVAVRIAFGSGIGPRGEGEPAEPTAVVTTRAAADGGIMGHPVDRDVDECAIGLIDRTGGADRAAQGHVGGAHRDGLAEGQITEAGRQLWRRDVVQHNR